MKPKQQPKSPAQKQAEWNRENRMRLGVTYTTTDGKQFHSEPLIITNVKGGQDQEKPSSKRKRDADALKDAMEHETNIRLKRDVTPVFYRKISKGE
jgi:hypothetical protein